LLVLEMAMRAAALAAALAPAVLGHGSMTIPKPRNTVDGDTAPWNGTVPWPQPFDNPNMCATPSADMHGKDPHNLTGTHGQACFWFSNGCDISVDKCDGNTGQVTKAKWHYTGPAGQNNGWTSEGIELMPPPASDYMSPATSSIAGRSGKKPLRNATLCDPNLRTVNTHAACECRPPPAARRPPPLLPPRAVSCPLHGADRKARRRQADPRKTFTTTRRGAHRAQLP
jgi:hypothetical protein